MSAPREYCFKCDQPTGRAGGGDDSIYDQLGNGPYCEMCYSQTDEYRRGLEEEAQR